jgi:hypothetical protein
LRLTKHYAMKTNRGVDVSQMFLTSALVGGEWSISHLCHFTPGERVYSNNWVGEWVDPRAGLGDKEK